MSKTKFFVSSTCFDLDQIREDIRVSLEAMGHDPILSEYPSFPVIPELGTIENCKRNVKENADIFVLVIGGRRGTLDKKTNKPVTNLEYETARQQHIDSFIFVKKSIINLVPLWERNPTVDFSSHVDSSELFQFIKKIQDENQWIFTYERASEIIEILKCQISCFLKYLIDRKKEGKLSPISEFVNETERSQQIALEKPDFWEFLLTIELLKSKLAVINRNFNDLEKGLIHRNTQKVNGTEFLKIVSTKCDDLVSLMNLLKVACTEEIPLSWGGPGVAGVATEIKRAVDIIVSGSEMLLEWEADLLSISPPDVFLKIKNKMQDWTTQIFNQLFVIPENIQSVIDMPNPEGQHTINLVFEEPPHIEELTEEIKYLSDNPALWAEDV